MLDTAVVVAAAAVVFLIRTAALVVRRTPLLRTVPIGRKSLSRPKTKLDAGFAGHKVGTDRDEIISIAKVK